MQDNSIFSCQPIFIKALVNRLLTATTSIRLLIRAFVPLMVASLPLAAQQLAKTDSLKRALTQADDTAKTATLFRLSMAYQYSEPDTAMMYARQLLQLAETLQDNQAKADGLFMRGRLRRDRGDYASALEDITASLKLYQTIPDSIQLANALNDISIVYAMSGNDDKALEYFEETLTLFQELGDQQGESYALNNIGAIYQEAGQLTKARDYMERSLKIKWERRDTLGVARSYFNLGDIAGQLGEPADALQYYGQANSLFRKINDKQGRTTTLNAIAGLYVQEGNLSRAKEYATQALSLAQEIKAPPQIEASSQTLVTISEQLGDYTAAYRYLQIQMAVKDSLFSADQTRRLDELKTQFDSEKQESKIAMLEKDRQLQEARLQQQRTVEYVLAVGVALLFLVLVVVLYAYRLSRQQQRLLSAKNQELQHKKEELRELNKTKDRFFSILSHDLKGPLNTLQGFVFLLSQQSDNMDAKEVKNISAQISESLNNLYRLLENLLTWSLSQLQHKAQMPDVISLSALIEDTLRLLKPTANKKQLQLVSRACPKAVAWADTTSVSTVLRNLVANSIKFSYPDTRIVVEAEVVRDEVLVRVIDQGTGIDKETQSQLFSLDKKATGTGTHNERGSGFGLVLCEELVRKNGGRLWVESELGNGSTFTFTLPLAERVAKENTSQQRTN